MTNDRHEENQRRIKSYTATRYSYRNGDGVIRFATEEDYTNTLEADGFEPYNPTDEERAAMRDAPAFSNHKGR